MAGPRVLLADDHNLLLGAFEKLLSPECEIVGSVSDGRSLVVEAQRLKPDVVVLDIGMPLLNGLDAGRQIKQLQKSIRLVFVTMNEDSDLAAEAFRAGASAYLLKRSAASELLVAIREVMKGRSYVTPLITQGLVGSFLDAANQKPSHDLTPRQREVLQLLAEGKTMKEAATLMGISTRAAESHKYEIMRLLGVKTTTALIKYAVRVKLV